jgi:uncharacterized SAM-binding protein YcdF (DUF218 family)
VVVAALLVFWSRASWLTRAARFLDVSDPPPSADYVMVLGGGSDTRPFVAAAWVLRGKAKAILIPTVQTPPGLVDGAILPDHEVIRRVLLAQGVSQQCITILPGECSSTRDEAKALAIYLEAHPGVSVAIVTNTLYTRRTRSIMCRELGKNSPQVAYIGAPTDRFDETIWWKMEEGFQCYATEYVKLVAYWLSF